MLHHSQLNLQRGSFGPKVSVALTKDEPPYSVNDEQRISPFSTLRLTEGSSKKIHARKAYARKAYARKGRTH